MLPVLLTKSDLCLIAQWQRYIKINEVLLILKILQFHSCLFYYTSCYFSNLLKSSITFLHPNIFRHLDYYCLFNLYLGAKSPISISFSLILSTWKKKQIKVNTTKATGNVNCGRYQFIYNCTMEGGSVYYRISYMLLLFSQIWKVENVEENGNVILPITRALSIKRRCFIVFVIRFCL